MWSDLLQHPSQRMTRHSHDHIATDLQSRLQIGLDAQLFWKRSIRQIARVTPIALQLGEMLCVASPQQSRERDAS
jgi:hypothetical protein